MNAERGVGQIRQIGDGPALPFQDDAAAHADHPLGDDAVIDVLVAPLEIAALERIINYVEQEGVI